MPVATQPAHTRAMPTHPPAPVRETNGDHDEAPTDADLLALRHQVDAAEHALTEARRAVHDGMRAALDDGVTMTHVARITGWSRQWCYAVLERWGGQSGDG
jgi:hypothetical protein